MEDYEIKLIESVVLIVILVVLSKAIQTVIEKAGSKFSYHKTRVKVLKKVTVFISYVIFIGVLLLIWGIAPSELGAYVASLLTVVGIAFLAQWSIISNITATLIIFFNHQVKIGDKIVIIDKDYHVEGKVSDIGIFFVIVKVNENEYVSLPSNVFMQKMVKKINP